jgi:glyoxylate/hydroxypyruvate reductase
MFEVSTAARLHLHELKRVDMDELARESDVLVVLAPGGSNTYHIINEDFLRKMKNTAILVNTSRGSLVDSDALAKALQEKWIWGAGLDVVEGKRLSGFSLKFFMAHIFTGEPKVGLDHPLVKEPRYVIFLIPD